MIQIAVEKINYRSVSFAHTTSFSYFHLNKSAYYFMVMKNKYLYWNIRCYIVIQLYKTVLCGADYGAAVCGARVCNIMKTA